MFESLVAEARRPHWYLEGGVADSVDGRFAMLATVVALASVRLEQGGALAQEANAALAERFVEAMDAEHRQMGVSDPGIGKQVRKLLATLARRVGLWREAVAGRAAWTDATRDSLSGAGDLSEDALARCAESIAQLWKRLDAASDDDLAGGRL